LSFGKLGIVRKIISKINFAKVKRTLLLSAICIVVICVGALIYGRIVAGSFTLVFLFPANFLIGAIIIMAGMVALMIPTRLTVLLKLRNNKLIDHSNYAEFIMEKREQKRKVAHEFIYLGMSIIAITAFVQLLLSVIIT
jgi:hypothetical protein